MDEEMKKTKDQEAEQKAKQTSEMHKKLAERHASAFEEWLNEHKDATKEEAHERLVETIEAAIMFGLMTVIMM